MNQLLYNFISAIKAKLLPITRRVRLWLSPAFLQNKIFSKFRIFFTNLLDIRPRNASDYYTIFHWMVSKRLAFSIVVGLGLVSSIYIVSNLPENLTSQEGGVKTFKYRSIPLRFYEGNVNILDRNGQIGYAGQVKAGAAEGIGTVYDVDGNPVYEGRFSASRYNGHGTLYYPSGVARYTGDFVDNLFQGVGSYQRPSGVLEYKGDYVAGVRSGSGTLFNSVGSPVFTGSFLYDEVMYSDLLGRPTSEMSATYTGRELVYQSEDEYCVGMPDIQALCSIQGGENDLENEWTVSEVIVLSPALTINGTVCSTIDELDRLMGTPHYYGSSRPSLAEAAAVGMLKDEAAEQMPPMELDTTELFQDVWQVNGYGADSEIFLYTYELDGLLYTFYTAGAGLPGFQMYSIALA